MRGFDGLFEGLDCGMFDEGPGDAGPARFEGLRDSAEKVKHR